MAHPAPRTSMGPTDLTGRQLGRYEVLTMLASGGMATVYVARAQGVAGFERLVAVKVLHPHLAHDEEFISMFLDEARLAARIRHPNAVGTLDISDTHGDGYFLVMEYVEGDHFGALLREAAKGGEKVATPVVARIVMDALGGLHAAHTLTDPTGQPLRLVHRDISPHNILVGADGAARITDFGVAKAQIRLSSTRDGQFKGKLSYMAPEQASSGQADQRSDLFSMAIVMWEGLTGRRLFRGENNADVLNKILNPDVPAPSTFDPALVAFDPVAKRALSHDPDARYQTAEEFLEAIEAAALSAGGVATPRAVAREVKRWLGEKVERERKNIQDAMEALGRSELVPGVLPRPMEGGSSPSQVRSLELEDATVGAKPSRLLHELEAEPAQPATNKLLLPLIAVIALFLIGGGVAAFVILGGSDPGATAPSATPVTGASDTATGTATAPTEATVAPEDAVGGAEAGEGAEDGAGAGSSTETAADIAADTAEADEPPSRDTSRSGRRQGRSRHGRRGSESGGSAGGGGSGASTDDEDDLLVNPYRR